MAIKVVYLKTASDDLRAIFNYISHDSVKYARIEIKKIKAYCDSLRYHLLKGKEFKQVRGRLTRSIVFRNYVIFYFFDGDQINILTIHHHSRNLSNNPAFSSED